MQYTPSASLLTTKEEKLRNFINAKTPYDQYKVVMELLSWIDALEELNFYLNNKR